MKTFGYLAAMAAIAVCLPCRGEVYTYLDLHSGKEVTLSEPCSDAILKVTPVDNGTEVEINADYADVPGIIQSRYGETTCFWNIPMEQGLFSYDDISWGRPCLPVMKVLEGKVPEGCTSVRITMGEAEYCEFDSPIRVRVFPIEPYSTETKVNDYEGFWPETARDLVKIVATDKGKLAVRCALMQYDAQHHKVRIYRSIKFRLDYEQIPTEEVAEADVEPYSYIDLATGQPVTLDSAYEGPEIIKDYDADDSGANVDIRVSYADIPTVKNTFFGPTALWSIPNTLNAWSWCAPPIPAVEALACHLPEGCNAAEVIVTTGEFRDFKSRISAAETPEETMVNPYVGLWPTDDADLIEIGNFKSPQYKDSPLTVKCSLMQYNYETETVRIYRHIKLRVNFLKAVEGGIETPEGNVAGPVRYFDMQGREVTEPARGRIYILRRGDSAEKVRY